MSKFLSSFISLSAVSLSACLLLSGCNNTASIPAHTDSKSFDHHSAAQPILSSDANNINKDMTQCPPFNPEMNMCTMQYDPVCVKEKQTDGRFVYRTAGNACMACGKPEAVEYYLGECK